MPVGHTGLALGARGARGGAVSGGFALGGVSAALALGSVSAALTLTAGAVLVLFAAATNGGEAGAVRAAGAASSERLAQPRAIQLESQTRTQMMERGDSKTASFYTHSTCKNKRAEPAPC